MGRRVRGEDADSGRYAPPPLSSEQRPQEASTAHGGAALTTKNTKRPESAEDIPQHLTADELLANARRCRSAPGLKMKVSAHYFYEAFLDRHPTHGAVYEARREMKRVDEELDRMKVNY